MRDTDGQPGQPARLRHHVGPIDVRPAALAATFGLGEPRRCAATQNLLVRRDFIAAHRRFTGAPLTGFGAL